MLILPYAYAGLRKIYCVRVTSVSAMQRLPGVMHKLAVDTF